MEAEISVGLVVGVICANELCRRHCNVMIVLIQRPQRLPTGIEINLQIPAPLHNF